MLVGFIINNPVFFLNSNCQSVFRNEDSLPLEEAIDSWKITMIITCGRITFNPINIISKGF